MSIAVSTEQVATRRSVATWWRSRFGAQLAFEIALCGALLVIYRAIRTVTKSDLRSAFANTREVIAFESWLGLPFEDDLQRWLLDHPAIIKFLNHYYVAMHFPVAIGLLLFLYLRHHDHYRFFRNLMAFVTFVGLIIHLAFPLAPPRMMTGFVDTMREFGPSIYPKNALDGAANQIAAMPSLHFGWALIAAIAVIRVWRTRWRYLALIHPSLMVLAIIATANHWWLDAAAAGVIIAGAVAAWRFLVRWAGDRVWSWEAMRFQHPAEIARLQALAAPDASQRRAVELVD